MENETLKTARAGIDAAHTRIDRAVENLLLTVNPGLAEEASRNVQAGCVDLSNHIILGADAVAESFVRDAQDFQDWQDGLGESVQFTQTQSDRLKGFADGPATLPDSMREAVAYSRGALDTATQVALDQRERGILASLTGPLADYALEDARSLGLLAQPEREESGVLLAKVPPEAVLTRDDGSLVAVPVPPDLVADVGKPVHLRADEIGVYYPAQPERKMDMEPKTENRLVQHHTLADAFLQVKDGVTDQALSAARADIGDADWKKGFTVEKRDKVREVMKAHGVPLETRIVGTLDRVALAETRNGNQVFQKLRVTLAGDAGGKTVLSADLDSEFAQRLVSKLEAAQPGQAVSIGAFASVKEKDGRTFVDHVATLQGPDGKEIQPAKEHFKEAQALADKALAPLQAAGLGSNQTLLTQTAAAARTQYFAQVVRGMESRFPEKAVQPPEKRQYPRLEGHLRTKDGTWHSVSLYVDKEGQPRGLLAVENREQGIAEKAPLIFSEKQSEKTGERFLAARMDRVDGSTLYVHLMPHGKDGERWLSASFAERDPTKEKDRQLSGIEGKGGGMKPNPALLDAVETDRTAQYLRDTLKIDPVKIHEREQARKSPQQGVAPRQGVSR